MKIFVFLILTSPLMAGPTSTPTATPVPTKVVTPFVTATQSASFGKVTTDTNPSMGMVVTWANSVSLTSQATLIWIEYGATQSFGSQTGNFYSSGTPQAVTIPVKSGIYWRCRMSGQNGEFKSDTFFSP